MLFDIPVKREKTMKGSYVGSVRFYKNLILAFVVLAIGLGAFFSIHYHNRLVKTREELTSLKDVTSQFLMEDESGRLVITASDEPSYQALYPDFYAPAMPVTSDEAERTIYLTFNDGPSPVTAALLDSLKKSDVHATFFLTGSDTAGEDTLPLLKRMVDEGHTVGMLSWSNSYDTIYNSVESYLDDMYRIFSYIKENTGVTPTFFRFPGGSVNSYNAGLYQELIAEMLRRGFVPFDWNVSAQDTVPDVTSAQISDRVVLLSSSMTRSIVLLHDEGEETVEALHGIIKALKAEKFSFAPLTASVKPILFSY